MLFTLQIKRMPFQNKDKRFRIINRIENFKLKLSIVRHVFFVIDSIDNTA